MQNKPTFANASMNFKGTKYLITPLVRHAGTCPVITVDLAELILDVVVLTKAEDLPKGEVLVIKHEGKMYALLGHAKIAELKKEGETKVRARLVTKHILKHCLPAPVVVDEPAPSVNRYRDHHSMQNNPRMDDNWRNTSFRR